MVKYRGKTKDDLIDELAALRQEVSRLEEIDRRCAELETRCAQQGQVLNALLDSSPDFLLLKDRQSVFRFCNRAFCSFWDYSPEDVLGKDDFALFPAEEAQRYRDEEAEVMRSRQPLVREHLLSRGPVHMWQESIKVPVFDDAGEVVGVLCMERDISARKEMESALREKEESYRLIVENADAAIARIRADGEFLFMNRRAAEMLGGKPEDFVGKRMWGLFPPAVAESQMAHVARVIQSKKGFTVEALSSVRGEPRWFSDNIQPVVDADGSVSSAQLIAIDVTERRRAEQALRESEKRYKRIVETAQEGIWILDSEGRTEYVNQSMADMLGYTVQEMQGRDVLDFMDESLQPLAQERLELRRQGIAGRHDFLFRRKDGSHLWTMISARPIFEDDGRYLGVLGMVVDISERRRAEEALQASEQLYRQTIDAFDDMIHAVDADLRFTLLGRSVLEWRGQLGLATPSIGADLFEVFSFLPESVRDEYRRVFATGKMVVTEETFRFGNRTVVSETRKIPVRQDGRVSQVLTVLRDITERWRAEQLLHIQRDLGLALGSTSDRGHILKYAMEAVRQIEGIDCGGVYVVDGASGELNLAIVEGVSQEFAEAVRRYPGDSPHARLVLAGQPVYGHHPAFPSMEGDAVFAAEGLRAVAVIPMHHEGRTVGCLNLSSHTHDDIPPGARDGLEAIASQVASALIRVRALDALEKSEAQYRAVVEDQTELICRCTPDGTATFANDALCRYLGRTREQVVGHSLCPILVRAPREGGQTPLSRPTPEASVAVREHPVLRADGAVRWVQWTERGFFDAEGRLTELQAVGRDISERKTAEAREREYVESLAFLSKTAMGFVEFPADKDIYQFVAEQVEELAKGSIVVINSFDGTARSFKTRAVAGSSSGLETFFRTVGRDPVGMTFTVPYGRGDLPPDLTRSLVRTEGGLRARWSGHFSEAILSELEDGLNLGAVYVQAFINRGQLFGTAVILVPSDSELKNRDLLETLINQASVAVQRRQAEEALREKDEQLRQLNKMEALGRLAGGIAHDFDNILANILGYASLIRSRLPDDSPLFGEMDVIVRSCHRASDMTAELLTFARGGVVELTSVDLNSIVREVDDLLWERLGDFVEVDLQLAEGLPRVRGDASQLHQVVLNLSLNACDAVLAAADPRGWSAPHVVLETYPVTLDEAAARHVSVSPGDYVCLRVEDSGLGMDAETMNRVFDPFFTTKDRSAGLSPSGRPHSGLGLATVYSVVQSHEGAVKLDSAPGSGTTFSVYLPVVADEAPSTASSLNQLEIAHSRILIIDDDPDHLRLCATVLRGAGYEVVTADGEAAGLTALAERDEAIDLIVLGVLAPPSDTTRLYRQIKAVKPLSPVLAMSTASRSSQVPALLAEGVSDSIQKPFEPPALVHRVRRLLGQASG